MRVDWRKNYSRYKSYFLNVLGRYQERTDLKVYLEILLSLATVSVFSIFALRPTLLTIAELIKEIEAKKETLEIMNNKIQNLSKAQSLYDQERAGIILLETAIPKYPNPDVFSRQIEGIVLKNQVALSSTSIGSSVVLGKYTTEKSNSKEDTAPFPQGSQGISYQFNVQSEIGNYPQFAKLVNDLENLRRPTQIESLRVSIEKQEGENVLSLTVNGKFPQFTGVITEADE